MKKTLYIPLFSLAAGLILGFFFFSKQKPITTHEDNSSLDTSNFELKSCEKREKNAQEEIARLQAQLSELEARTGTQATAIAKTPTQIQTPTQSEPQHIAHDNTPTHTLQTSTYKEQVQEAVAWMEGERKLSQVKSDPNSTSEFLKSVTITNLNNVRKFTNTVERTNPKFLALQGNFHGTMKSLDHKEYSISLELTTPPEGQISYVISIEGDDIHSTTRGQNEKAKGFTALKDDSSKTIFIKVDKIQLQVYPTNNNQTLIGNAYRKSAKSAPYVKFAEFEMTR